ncbi:MAG TPA: carboxypeptidase-like regulatory domain-containing protein [Clostridiales bacterium]|nr:carboxypeptidase-like regulatory domain-containing protein [Clostridiales bacterium]
MKLFSIILISVFSLLNTTLASQYGSISGYVYDENLELLSEWVHISMKGTNYSTRTDKDGYYIIIGIPSGTYTIKFDMVGYEPTKVHYVRVLPDSETEIPACLFSMSLADPPEHPSDFDGSNAIITPYNPSQKILNLEKIGIVDIKEKTKYSKLDMIEIYPLIKDGKHLKYKIDKNIEGEYISTDGKQRVIFKVNEGQLFRQKIYPNSKGMFKPLFNTGNNRFITFGEEVIFETDSVIIQRHNYNGQSYKIIFKRIN